jgi:lysophospholipase L1-like esterase
LKYLKETYPTKQIILLTPIHRGYATFGDNNIQPDESYPNGLGLYIDDYVSVLKEAANVWAVPVIDLNSVCGIMPNLDSNTVYINKEQTDRLHPNAAGHERMAKALMYQLLNYPSSF